MSIKVTWLLPVKNGMPFLPETLASLEAQTYTNWEILAWDNGSTDGTLEVLHDWIPRRLPGKVVTDRPAGLGASLALMVEEAETDLCARIDADDVNFPERLEKQVAYLSAHPEIAAVGAQVIRIDAEGIEYGPFVVRPTQHDDIVNWMLFRNPMVHPSMTFRRSAILDVGNYRDVGPINIEDYDLWMRLAMRYKLANLDDFLLQYRVHSESTTVLAVAANRLFDAVLIRYAEHAPQLFGCSSDDARLLRSIQHPCALKPLLVIAKHLKKTQGGERIRSQSFLYAAHHLVRPRDYITRLFLISCLKGPSGAAGETVIILKHIYRRFRQKIGTSAFSSPPGSSSSAC